MAAQVMLTAQSVHVWGDDSMTSWSLSLPLVCVHLNVKLKGGRFAVHVLPSPTRRKKKEEEAEMSKER